MNLANLALLRGAALLAAALTAVAQTSVADEPAAEPGLDFAPVSLWEGGIGEGFRKGTSELSASVAPGWSSPIFGSSHHHDWVLGFVEYGSMLSGMVAKEHWHRGNWELVGDLFGGFQYHPDHAYVIGITPLVRYNFATGTRWIPFINAGAGLTGTDIRDGDLSTKFEFNLQFGGGVHYFLKDNLSLDFQYRFIHLSNAGLNTPNLGVNSSNIMLGGSWFF